MAQRSPCKPRILWRGEFLLQDGTALPGLTIVSSTQPGFANSSNAGGSTQLSLSAFESGKDQQDRTKDLFTLSKEQQDDLSLAIEMVRHAPLRISDVRSVVELDEQGKLCSTATSKITERPAFADAHPSICTTYEAAGDVQLHVDPAEKATTAFFERVFAYDALGVCSDETGGTDCGPKAVSDVAGLSFSRSVLTFSFNKVTASLASSDDVFSSAYTMWAANQDTHNSIAEDGGMEAAVIGIVQRTLDGKFEHVELHVGRKITRRAKLAIKAEGTSGGLFSRSKSNAASRPDDPAPRIVGSGASRSKLPFLPSKSTSSVLRAPRSSGLVMPRIVTSKQRGAKIETEIAEEKTLLDDAGAKAVAPITTYKRGGAHTPGRRGEKRPRISAAENPIKITKSEPLGSGAATLKACESTGLEEQNRSLIKKLVHYQLLGKGVERHEETYTACFSPTCQGTLLAFRRIASIELIDKQAAAAMVERHLDMYL